MRKLIVGVVIVGCAACVGGGGGGSGGGGGGHDEPEPRTTFGWEPMDVTGVTPRWGSYVVEGSGGTGYLLGGVTNRIQEDGYALHVAKDSVDASPDLILDATRYCHCAMLDSERNRVIVLGGRTGANYVDAVTAAAVTLDTAEATLIDDAGAADHPVGCQAFFFPALDRGYVFGGLSSDLGEFTPKTFRFDATTDTFTELDIAGPAARYDAGTHLLANGTALLVGGMGRTAFGALFFSDMWTFDPASETWTEVPANNAPPAGRRYPWTSLSPDESMLLYGYGSDSGTGQTVLGDLNAFDFASGTWSVLPVDGDSPAARGFTYRWPGPAGSAGILAYGFDGTVTVEDAFVLRVPDDVAGDGAGAWH